MPGFFLYKALLLGLLVGLLGGCSLVSPVSLPETPETNTTSVATPPAVATPATTILSPTLTLPPVLPTAAVVTPEPSLTPTSRPPSGWTLYSNPDFVQGIDLEGNMLWAATLGGVVRWNLDTQTPELFTTRDGLVEIRGNDVAVCGNPEAQVLIAHETGVLSAYNPNLAKWSRIPITFDDGTTLGSVQTLFCDQENNRLLVGSPEGLGIYDLNTNRWRRIGPEEGLAVDEIKAIDVVGQTIWIAAGDQSAFMIMGSTIFPFNGASGFPSGPINDLSVGPDLSIWFGYPTGLVHYRDKRWNSYGGQARAGIPFVSVDRVEVASQQLIWIASSDQGACPFDIYELSCSTIYSAPQGAPITDLMVDSNGVAYASTYGQGVMVLLPEQRINLLLDKQQLISSEVFDITEGEDGNLWLATSRGINILDPARPDDSWQSILPERNKLAFPRVSNLQPVSDGMWVFYEQEPQASFYNGSEWLHMDSARGISAPVLDSAVDQRGYIWFTTERSIDIWDGIIMRSYGPTTGLAGNVFQAIYENDGEMWVGTDRGLLQYQRYRWIALLPGFSVNAILEDPGGKLLFGTDQGLIRYDGSQVYQWVINLENTVKMNPVVTALSWDLNGHLWVGTQSDGLFYNNGKGWRQFDTTDGIPTNQIRKIYTDRFGAVWIAAVSGPDGGALMRYMP